VSAPSPKDEATRLRNEIAEARKALGLGGAAPSTDSIEIFLAAQREKIRNRYGDKPVKFSVDTSGDKPRIKVSLIK
jgi:hypothetical protein